MLTKILSFPLCDSKFLICYLRFHNIQKSELNLQTAKRGNYKITDPRIRKDISYSYKIFKEEKIDHSDYFKINFIIAKNENTSPKSVNVFHLKATTFKEDWKVYSLLQRSNIDCFHFRASFYYVIKTAISFLKAMYNWLNARFRFKYR